MSASSVQQIPFNSYTPRVAIVTGGAQGIGYAISHRLADDGLDVAINDVGAQKDQITAVVEELNKKGRRAIAIPGDVSSEADVISMIEKTVQELGGVDVMVANAGIAPFKPFFDISVDEFDTVYSINARSVFLCFKHAAAQMIKQGRGGRLLAASSIGGRKGQVNYTSYSASKFAIRGIVQCAAAELRKHGITANAYCPGPIMTEMLRKIIDAGTFKPTTIGEPDDVASIVSYLVKPSPTLSMDKALLSTEELVGLTSKHWNVFKKDMNTETLIVEKLCKYLFNRQNQCR